MVLIIIGQNHKGLIFLEGVGKMKAKDPATIRRTDRSNPEETDLIDHMHGLRKPIAGDVPLSEIINPMVQEGELYEKLPGGAVHCYACGHNCKINPGGRGICQVRYNIAGKLYVPFGYVAALQCDPTEKKPFFHIYPGSDTLTFGMLGCDIHCLYCQNWDISQALRDANAGRPPALVTPKELVQLAKQNSARCVASSYNEPLITSEWAAAVFKEAKAAGFTCMYVSNGNATRQVLEYIRPFTDGYKIDLKTMNDKSYRTLGAVLDRVLDGVRMVHSLGFWLEIVTLVVPGFNDSKEELLDAAQFIKSVSADIPWHLTAFHKDYRMTDPNNTSAKTLIHAAEIGYQEGLNYVYTGNLPGQVGEFENTYCPNCRSPLIKRYGYIIEDYRLTAQGTCPKCNTHIPGIWTSNPKTVRLGGMGLPRFVRR
jgi:pyruvate formate lyase activating enzyme